MSKLISRFTNPLTSLKNANINDKPNTNEPQQVLDAIQKVFDGHQQSPNLFELLLKYKLGIVNKLNVELSPLHHAAMLELNEFVKCGLKFGGHLSVNSGFKGIANTSVLSTISNTESLKNDPFIKKAIAFDPLFNKEKLSDEQVATIVTSIEEKDINKNITQGLITRFKYLIKLQIYGQELDIKHIQNIIKNIIDTTNVVKASIGEPGAPQVLPLRFLAAHKVGTKKIKDTSNNEDVANYLKQVNALLSVAEPFDTQQFQLEDIGLGSLLKLAGVVEVVSSDQLH